MDARVSDRYLDPSECCRIPLPDLILKAAPEMPVKLVSGRGGINHHMPDPPTNARDAGVVGKVLWD